MKPNSIQELLLQHFTKASSIVAYYDQSLPAFRCKVYHPKGALVADVS